MAIQIQLRRGLASEWTSANPILADGEVGYEKDTRKEKVGDGVTAWTSLPYKISGNQDLTPYQLKPSEGEFENGDKTKLDGITAGATPDQDISGIATNASAITNKQDALVSGTNIKTINGESLLGSSDITITDTVYDDSDVLKDSDSLTAVTPSNKLMTQSDVAGLGGGDMLSSTYDPIINANTAKVGVTTEEANPDVVGQAEAEAGTATTERIWTAERVKQAIVALGGSGSVDDTAYGISWDGVTGTAPSKNALYDFIESQVFKVDATSNIIPIFWGGTQAEYDIDFPSGHTSEYFIVITDATTDPLFDVYSDSPIKPIYWGGTDAEHTAKFGAGYVHPDSDFIVITDGVVPATNASDIVFTPNGSIAATDVQAAIQEVRDEASSGSVSATTGTGTAIDLTNVVGAYYNIGASSTATAFTVPTVAVGGFAVVQSASTTTEPTVTVTGGTATGIPSLAWVASTTMYLNIYSYDGTNVFYYWSDTTSIPAGEANTINSEPIGNEAQVLQVVSISQANYDLITPVATTLYVING